MPTPCRVHGLLWRVGRLTDRARRKVRARRRHTSASPHPAGLAFRSFPRVASRSSRTTLRVYSFGLPALGDELAPNDVDVASAEEIPRGLDASSLGCSSPRPWKDRIEFLLRRGAVPRPLRLASPRLVNHESVTSEVSVRSPVKQSGRRRARFPMETGLLCSFIIQGLVR